MKTDILAVGVHPDDVELSCAGTILKAVREGKQVVILDLTRGELGTRGDAESRKLEAEKAAQILGVKTRVQLEFPDGFFENTKEYIIPIIEQIRRFKPEIVLCNAVKDRHPDHARAAKLTEDACFYSGLLKIKTSWEGVEQECWRPRAVFNYIQDYCLEPDFVVDVTEFTDKKMEAIMAFSSQFYNPSSKEPETPISGKDFLEYIKSKMMVYGRPAGMKYAEGFTCSRTVGVKNIFDIL